MQFKSLPKLLDYFKDEATCIKHFEQMRWNGNPVCPHCNADKPYATNRGYRCRSCKKKFTVKIGTVYQSSKIPLRLWFAAIYLFTNKKNGINSVDLAKVLGITQKTAWFLLHRIRTMMKNSAPQTLSGVVETDETHVGGKEKNRHLSKKIASKATGLANDGTIYNEKKTVIGMIERGGNLILKLIPDRRYIHITTVVKKHIEQGSTLMTDEAGVYSYLNNKFDHRKVNHSQCQYVDGENYTNTIENAFSCVKRTLGGCYHTVSRKHMQKYLDEISTKFNHRQTHPSETFNIFLSRPEGRLLYKNLTSKN